MNKHENHVLGLRGYSWRCCYCLNCIYTLFRDPNETHNGRGDSIGCNFYIFDRYRKTRHENPDGVGCNSASESGYIYDALYMFIELRQPDDKSIVTRRICVLSKTDFFLQNWWLITIFWFIIVLQVMILSWRTLSNLDKTLTVTWVPFYIPVTGKSVREQCCERIF